MPRWRGKSDKRLSLLPMAGLKMINPGSYRFRLIALIHLKMINPGSYRFRLIALTHLGGWTGNVEKMINPGSYRFGPGHWQK